MNELAITRSLLPAPISDIRELASAAVKSALLGGAIKSAEQAFIIIATGMELGLQPMQSLRSIHVVEGKPVLSAQLLVALAKRHPDCMYFRLVESTHEKATFETQRKGDPKPTQKTWTIEDAKRAGLTGRPNWQRHPSAMLEARCSAALARLVYPDHLMGVYEESEGEDIKQSAKEEKPARVIDMPEKQPEPTDEERQAKFKQLIALAPSIAELKSVGELLSKEPKHIGDGLRNDYVARLTELKPKSLQPGDYDKMEQDRDAKKPSARDIVDQGRDNAQHHPPLSQAAAELMKRAGEASTEGDFTLLLARKNATHLTPLESKTIDEALRRRREKIARQQSEITDPNKEQLGDPKF